MYSAADVSLFLKIHIKLGDCIELNLKKSVACIKWNQRCIFLSFGNYHDTNKIIMISTKLSWYQQNYHDTIKNYHDIVRFVSWYSISWYFFCFKFYHDILYHRVSRKNFFESVIIFNHDTHDTIWYNMIRYDTVSWEYHYLSWCIMMYHYLS